MSDEEEIIRLPDPVNVPESLWSFESGAPFAKCLVCQRDLFSDPVPYLIEKAYEGDEVVLELAICVLCQTDMMKEFSKTSLKLVQHFLGEHMDLAGRFRQFAREFDGSIEPWLKECMVYRTAIEPKQGFRVAARCVGNQLDVRFPPHAISMAALEATQRLLSPATKGFLGEFTDRYFGVPTGADLPTIMPV